MLFSRQTLRSAGSRAQPATRRVGPALPSRRQPPRQGPATPVRALGGSDAQDAVSLLSSVLTTGAVAYGAWLLMTQSQSPLPEQDNLDGPSEPCPTCGGSGYEACMCQRWSDGDAGCGTCSKTGYMRCRHCGGGGKAVPYLVKVQRSPPRQL